ncbi:MAG: aminotransferase class V-fold PLP-dependent enzyme [Anaerolineales bacterium]|jgi:selenocysteine lyase/cysteine desulfurase
MTTAIPTTDLRQKFVGLNVEVPTLSGQNVDYINFDNAASTPPLKSVMEGINNFVELYSSVHRGTGFKSQLSTWAYEESRQETMRFVGANLEQHTCMFGKNTTEAINKLSKRLDLGPEDVILTSTMEHHSNDLPFRAVGEVVHIGLLPDGRLDEDDFDQKLARYKDRVKLVAVTGASNVTGYLNPIHRLAEKTHQAGTYFLADVAQLAPHRQVDMRSLDDPGHLDFVALSGHKLYAPFGTGALIGRKDVFEHGDPDMRGGGTVEIVTLGEVYWAEPPDRDEAGSPNVVGAVAMGLAMRALQEIGMDTVAAHEAELTARALERLTQIEGVHIFGDTSIENVKQRLGVIPFQIEGLSHFLAAAILGHEFGIGVRSGCFCAHPYVLHLLGLTESQAGKVRDQMLSGDKSQMPGLIRTSFGLYNSLEEVDRFADAIEAIASGRYQGTYHQDTASGEYLPEGWQPDFESYFDLS